MRRNKWNILIENWARIFSIRKRKRQGGENISFASADDEKFSPLVWEHDLIFIPQCQCITSTHNAPEIIFFPQLWLLTFFLNLRAWDGSTPPATQEAGPCIYTTRRSGSSWHEKSNYIDWNTALWHWMTDKCPAVAVGDGLLQCPVKWEQEQALIYWKESLQEINVPVPTWRNLVKRSCLLNWEMFPAILYCFSLGMKTCKADAQVSQHHFAAMLFSRALELHVGDLFFYLLMPHPKPGPGILAEANFLCRAAICHHLEKLPSRQEFGEMIQIWYRFLLSWQLISLPHNVYKRFSTQWKAMA